MSWWSRLRNALDPRDLDDSLDDEIRDHLERRTASLRESGLSEDEARRRARAAFGSVTRVRETSRDLRLSVGVESVVRDARYALRIMRRSPTFSLTAILSLAFAIGTNTAIYSIVDAAMFRPLPVAEPARVFTLVAPTLDPMAAGASGESELFSYPMFQQFRMAANDRAQLALFSSIGRADAQRQGSTAPVTSVRQQFVSGEAFAMLGVLPAVGRLFTRDDDGAPGEPRSIVLSFDYWQRTLGADPGVVDQRLTLDGRGFRVIGVAAKGFSGIEPGRSVDVWLPVTTFDPGVFTNPDAVLFRVLGRLAAGVTAQQLEPRLSVAYRDRQNRLLGQYAGLPAAALTSFAERHLQVRGGGVGSSEFRRRLGGPIFIVWGVAGAMLLVACANVGGLVLSRAGARASEMLLRTSLGASRRRLLQQLLTESVLLGSLGCVAGLMLGQTVGPWMVTWLSSAADPLVLDLQIDGRVLAFTAGIGFLTVATIGLIPAWHGARVRPLATWTPGSGDARRPALARLLVAVQVAFVCCLVVVGAGLILSLHRLVTLDMGFDPSRVTALTLRSDYGPKHEGLAATQQLQQQLARRPGIEGAAVAWTPMFGDTRRTEILLNGQPASERRESFYRVSSGYFDALKTPLLSGRDLEPRDDDGGAVVPTVVNRSFARRYFGSEAVVGREFSRGSDHVRHLVVGVVADAYNAELRSGLQPAAYFPMKPPRFFTLYVRSALDAGSVRTLVQQEAAGVGPSLSVVAVTTLETAIGNTLLSERVLAGVAGAFAGLGLLLVAIGLFGLLSYNVARRTKEIGLRAALGAQRRTLVMLVLKELGLMMAGGLTAGILVSRIAMRLLQAQFYDVASADPELLGGVALTLAFTTMVAVVVPAYRAATMDPLIALRHD